MKLRRPSRTEVLVPPVRLAQSISSFPVPRGFLIVPVFSSETIAMATASNKSPRLSSSSPRTFKGGTKSDDTSRDAARKTAPRWTALAASEAARAFIAVLSERPDLYHGAGLFCSPIPPSARSGRRHCGPMPALQRSSSPCASSNSRSAPHRRLPKPPRDV